MKYKYTRIINNKVYYFKLTKLDGGWVMIEKTTKADFPLNYSTQYKKKDITDLIKIKGYEIIRGIK